MGQHESSRFVDMLCASSGWSFGGGLVLYGFACGMADGGSAAMTAAICFRPSSG